MVLVEIKVDYQKSSLCIGYSSVTTGTWLARQRQGENAKAYGSQMLAESISVGR